MFSAQKQPTAQTLTSLQKRNDSPFDRIQRRGKFFVCVVSVLFSIGAMQVAFGQTETVLHSFAGGADVSGPAAGVIQDASGNLFGTTYFGGPFGTGTVFEISASGTESVLYTFTGLTDGGGPSGDLLLGPHGSLIGTTYFGGAFKNGTIFEISPSG